MQRFFLRRIQNSTCSCNRLIAKRLPVLVVGVRFAVVHSRYTASPEMVNGMLRRNWPAILLLMMSEVVVGRTTTAPPQTSVTLQQREHRVSRTLRRASQFVDVPHISSRPACASVEPPQALTTPDPVLTYAVGGRNVKVSFIIGTDGRVHSPLILESAGIAGDRRVLQTVRTWRYRPATCNGVPTETEGKIEFSSR